MIAHKIYDVKMMKKMCSRSNCQFSIERPRLVKLISFLFFILNLTFCKFCRQNSNSISRNANKKIAIEGIKHFASIAIIIISFN